MQKNKKTSRVLAFILCLAMFVSVFPLQAFANEEIKLKNGSAKITAEMTVEQVKNALFNALVENPEGKDAQSIEWEYGCDGYNGLLKNWAYGSVEGFQSKKALTYYTHPAIKDIADGTYNVRLKGTENFVRLTKTTKNYDQTNVVIKENIEKVLLYRNDDLSFNYDRLRTDLFNAVYDAEKSTPNDLKVENVSFQYDASRLDTIPIWQSLEFVDSTNIQRPIAEGGTYKFKMTVPETDSYYGTTVEFKVDVAQAPREESKINFTNKAYTYSSDYDAVRANIFKNGIDWKSSTLPSAENYGLEYYTIEYYAENLVAGKPAGTHRWVPLEGGTFALLNYPAMGAGEHQIRISFKGNGNFTSVVAEQKITVNKAKTTVDVHSTSKYADEMFPKDFVTVSSKDPFEIYTIYAGTTSSTVGAICVDLPDSITESFVIDLLNPIVKLVVGKSMDEIITNGITIGEINDIVNSKALKDLVAAFHIDLGVLGTVLEVLDNLPDSIKKISISFSEPNKAGLYSVIAIAANPNYETGVGLGVASVKMRHQQTKLEFNQKIEGRTLTVEQAKDFDFCATLSYQGIPVDQGSVHYLYSGVQANGRPYSSKTTPPTEPGSYAQTVVILGGNYMSAPITRSFTIK